MSLDPDKYRLTDGENQRIFDRRIKPAVFSRVVPTAQPVAVIFGGQPGSGKSAALEAAVQELAVSGGCAQIIGDDLREFRPAHRRLMMQDDKIAAFYTAQDSGRWVERAIAYAKEQRFNVVIEGTMRDAETVARTMTSLRQAGYRIEARAVAVNFQLSEQGIIQRYEAQKLDRGFGRMTTSEAHQAAYDGMPITLARVEADKLADRLAIYARGNLQIYENVLQDGTWRSEPRARQTVEDERRRPMTAEEHGHYVSGYEAVLALLKRPGRDAAPEEIKHVEDLLVRARASTSSAAVATPWNAQDYLRDYAAQAGGRGAAGSSESREQSEGVSPPRPKPR